MPSWDQFLNQHVLNPDDFPDWATWGKAQWNNWLRDRLGPKYGSKSINSVVVAVPSQVLASFEHPTVGHNRGEDFFWSEDRFQIFYLERTGTGNMSYDVRRLPPMYFLALIHPDPNRPVHFHFQAPNRVTFGQPDVKFNDYPRLP